MKDDGLYLHHILEAIERIQSYTSGGLTDFRGDLKTQDAVVRNLQIIGEASKKVSPETRAASPDLPWRDMAGMCDRIVHDYFGVCSRATTSHSQFAIPIR